MDLLLSPPVAFVIYIPLVLALLGVGRMLAGPSDGERDEDQHLRQRRGRADLRGRPGVPAVLPDRPLLRDGAPGDARARAGSLPPPAAVYLVGLFVALVALILG